MGPLGPPEMMQALGANWDRVKRPLILLLMALLGFIALLWLLS